ncbi:MAG: prenyltransferase [Anaerolineae bacterium]|nr:prenyltransferase [Anaerolineae bacterium]
MRLPFLVLPPVCVALGAGTAAWTAGALDWFYVTLAFVGAMAAHVSVNALNEYCDFRSGLDLHTTPTPFSGGSGTLAARPAAASVALTTGVVSMVIAAAVGVYFVAVWGPGLLPVGLLGLLVIAIYTPTLTRWPLLCLLAPGLGFGTFMVMGTDFVLTGHYSWPAFFASLVPFFLVSDLLLINQFPDVEADQGVGRCHYPIAIGRRRSSLIYGAFLLGAYGSIVAGWAVGALPAAALLGLLTLPLAGVTARGAYRHADEIDKLVPYLARNVLIDILTPALVAVGLFVAAG